MSKFFVVYDHATGAILRSGRCQDHMVEAQALADNERALETETHVDWATNVIDVATATVVSQKG